MLSRFAKSTVHFFVKRNIIESEDEEVYAYGTELLYSAVLNILLAIIISIITNTFYPTFLFMLSFVVIRQYIGGYHAETHIGCMSILGVLLIVFSQFIRFVPSEAVILISMILTAISVAFTIMFAPVEHPNKPLSKKEKNNLRKRGIIAVIVIAILIIVLSMSEITKRCGMYITLGMFTASIAMLCQVIKYCIKKEETDSDITGQN
ncbi:MAG: accessory gene regulator B family protein [Oscillospiraceae bacterium]|nr:accessory gene regulator B family protein [Oscillospiraceae bacterium]